MSWKPRGPLTPQRQRVELGFFIHPLPIAAVAFMVLNDHYLKFHYPSWLTGKLSDFAGMFFMPLFLCAWVAVFDGGFTRRRLIAAIALTDLVFIGVKFIPEVTASYIQTLEILGLPSRVFPDPTDVIALTMNVATYLFGKRHFTDQ